MSTYTITQDKIRKALGLAGRARPEHGRPDLAPSVLVPRLVTRGQTKSLNPSRDESVEEEDVWDESERIEIRPGNNGHPIVKAHPTPFEQAPSAIAHVDALCFTVTPPNPADIKDSLSWIFPALVNIFGCTGMTETGGGWSGYGRKFDLGTPGAFLAIGGKSQRGTIHVELMGVACAKVSDWHKVQVWGETVGAKITRIDLAHDDHRGENINVELAALWYGEGRFNNGGRPPKQKTAGDWHTPGSPSGRTFYVGTGASGKLARTYEKGKQLGDRTSRWNRVEVEWKSQNRVLAWDMVTKPGQYLAGAYPCLKFLSTLQDKVKTFQKAAKISLGRATENLRHAGGKVVNVLMMVHGDAVAVVNALRRDGIPGRLEPYQGLMKWPDLMNPGGLHAALDD
jgi:phage replication initiation protein